MNANLTVHSGYLIWGLTGLGAKNVRLLGSRLIFVSTDIEIASMCTGYFPDSQNGLLGGGLDSKEYKLRRLIIIEITNLNLARPRPSRLPELSSKSSIVAI